MSVDGEAYLAAVGMTVSGGVGDRFGSDSVGGDLDRRWQLAEFACDHVDAGVVAES